MTKTKADAPSASELGLEFARALSVKDFARIASVLDPDVDFRALTPRKNWEARGPRQVVDDVLRVWFGESDKLEELVNVESGHVASRCRVEYRLRGHDDDGPFLVEQQAYFDVHDGRINWMRVLCSGFQRA